MVTMKKYFQFMTSVLMVSLLAYASLNNAAEINTPNEIPVPRKNYPVLYTLNAKTAILLKNDDNHYQLILEAVDDKINFRYKNKMSVQPVKNFINLWQLHASQGVEADITGIQVNNQSFGHTQFYASLMLSHPLYNFKIHEIVFDVINIQSKIKIKQPAQFDNVTLFINGCTLYTCANKFSIETG